MALEIITNEKDIGKQNIRQEVALQLMSTRQLERQQGYSIDRRGELYLAKLEGLECFFHYLKQFKKSNIVYDIGAGLTRGISEISRMDMAEGLNFLATGLDRPKEVQSWLGNSRYRITSAEILRGIADQSVAGIIALHSIVYSKAPTMVINRINQVLIPGGAIKATFRGSDSDISKDFCQQSNFQYPDEFVQALKLLGYDTALSYCLECSILLAIKPGENITISAQKILDYDKQSYSDNRQSLCEDFVLNLLK